LLPGIKKIQGPFIKHEEAIVLSKELNCVTYIENFDENTLETIFEKYRKIQREDFVKNIFKNEKEKKKKKKFFFFSVEKILPNKM
jgi:hypothetical protein